MKLKFAPFIVIVWLVLLTGCEASENNEPRLESAEEATQPSQQVSDDGGSVLFGNPQLDSFQLSNESLSGRIHFLYRDDIYQAEFYGESAILVDENVTIEQISPDHKLIIYSKATANTREFYEEPIPIYYMLDTTTNEVSVINKSLLAVDAKWHGWSPDGKNLLVHWIADNFSTIQQSIIGTDGSIYHLPTPEVFRFPWTAPEGVNLEDIPIVRLNPVPLEQFRTTTWLDDGRLLIIFENSEDPEFPLFAQFFDPDTNMFEDISDDFDHIYRRIFHIARNVLNGDYDATIQDLRAQFDFYPEIGVNMPYPLVRNYGYEVAPSSRNYELITEISSPTTNQCSNIEISIQPRQQAFLPEIIFENEVIHISPLVLDEERQMAFFVQSVSDTCSHDNLRQELVGIPLSGTYESQIIFQTESLDTYFETELVYAPTGDYILWTSLDSDEGQVILIMTDIATGRSEQMMRLQTPSLSNVLLRGQLPFSPLTWIEVDGN